MIGSPAVAGGLVFASADLRTYYAVNVSTGDVAWTFSDPDAMEFIVSSPIYVNGQVYLIDKFSITSLNAANGETNWSFFTGDELYSSLSYADGKIYIVTSQRHIFILDANNNGTKMAMYTTPSSSWSSPTIANGRLYVGNHDWNVYCFADSITNQASSGSGSTETTTPPDYRLAIAIIVVVMVAVIAVVLVFALRGKSKKRTVLG